MDPKTYCNEHVVYILSPDSTAEIIAEHGFNNGEKNDSPHHHNENDSFMNGYWWLKSQLLNGRMKNKKILAYDLKDGDYN